MILYSDPVVILPSILNACSIHSDPSNNIVTEAIRLYRIFKTDKSEILRGIAIFQSTFRQFFKLRTAHFNHDRDNHVDQKELSWF